MYFTKHVFLNDVNEFKKHLNFCRKHRRIELRSRKDTDGSFIANLEIGISNVDLTYVNDKQKIVCYNFRLDGDENDQYITGGEAWNILNKNYYKVPNLRDIDIYGYEEKYNDDGSITYSWKGLGLTKAILYFNPKFNNQRFDNSYGYDLNSAFSYGMLQPMPDTTVIPRINDKVKKNEIGFREVYKNDEINYEAVFNGRADYVFPLIKSPFEKFVKTWYKRKKNAKTKEEKGKAKGVLNYSIGYLQKYNPFLRAAIITYSNDFIMNLMDENTLYCNTDSIVSKVKRPDIEKNLGDDIGQWKIEHFGKFAYRGYSYQWDNTIPSVRGISKKWFKKDFDILVDPIPKQGNVWYIDRKTFELKEVIYG